MTWEAPSRAQCRRKPRGEMRRGCRAESAPQMRDLTPPVRDLCWCRCWNTEPCPASRVGASQISADAEQRVRTWVQGVSPTHTVQSNCRAKPKQIDLFHRATSGKTNKKKGQRGGERGPAVLPNGGQPVTTPTPRNAIPVLMGMSESSAFVNN